MIINSCSLLSYTQNLLKKDSVRTSADSYFDAADSLWKIAEYDSSNYYYEKALQYYKHDANWENQVNCYRNLGINNRFLGKFDDALVYLDSAIDITNKNVGDKDSFLIDINNSKGSIFYEQGSYDEALDFYNKSLNLSLKRFGDESSSTGKGYHNAGLIYYRWGDAEKAMEYFEKALSIWLKTVGPEHTYIANCYTNMANVYFMTGYIEKSIEYDERALQIWTKRLGENNIFVAYSYNNLGNSYQYLGKYKKALELAKKSLSIKIKLGEDSPELAEDYTNVGNIFSDLNQFDSSYFYLNRSREIQLNTAQKNPFILAANYLRLAELFSKQQLFGKAVMYYDSSLAITYPKILSAEYSHDIDYQAVPRDKVFVTAVIEKANDLFKKYQKNSGKLADLSKSLLYSKIASNVLEGRNSQGKNQNYYSEKNMPM